MPGIRFLACESRFHDHTMSSPSSFSTVKGGTLFNYRTASVRQLLESSFQVMPQRLGCVGPWSFETIKSGFTFCAMSSSKSSKSSAKRGLHSTAGKKICTRTFARDGSTDSINKGPHAKRSFRPKDDERLGLGSKSGCDGSLSSFSSIAAAGHVNPTVISPFMAISSATEEDAATLRLSAGTCTDDNHRNVSHTLPKKLLRVAVDVDEVLGSFLSTLNAFIAEKHLLKYNVSQYHVYDFMKIWRCSQAEANDLVHAFFESDHFKDGIPPIPGAHESLLHLANSCHLVVVTSRQHVIKNQTLDWIERHYPGIFDDVYFGNHFALEGEARPKSEICRSIGAEVLIDDNPRYAMECAQHDIEVLLFDHNDSYPWSKTADGPIHPLITRVKNWKDVEISLLAKVHGQR